MMHETWIGTKICQTIIMRTRGVLQLALQLNFWITKDTCNSLYLYAMSSSEQVAWVVKLQFIIYMVQFIAT
jgi:hypothetical protein